MAVRKGILLLFFVALSACSASRPVLYPNEHLKRAGRSAAEEDINKCMELAEGHLASQSAAGKAAESGAIGAATGASVGAAGGAAGGAVVGHAARGATVGAAGGGAAGATRGVLRGLFQSRRPSQTYRNFVNRCLREKGYDPIGWE